MSFYKKLFKRKIKNQSLKKNSLIFSNFGLKLLSGGVLDLKHLEIIRRLCVKLFSKLCKIIFRIFINYAITKKSKNSRLGKGVGKFEKYIFNVKHGQIIIEFINIDNIYKITTLLKFLFRKFNKSLVFIYNIFFRYRFFKT